MSNDAKFVKGRRGKTAAPPVNGVRYTTMGAARQAAVSRARVVACLNSAVLWAGELPRYASRQQSKADSWALIAGIVSTVTGLAIFPVITDAATDQQKFVVALFAFAAGVCALVPRVKNYGEMAGKARELSAAYGPLVGRLMDALADMDAGAADEQGLRAAISDFEATKAKKDELRYLPRAKREASARKLAEQQVRDLVGRATCPRQLSDSMAASRYRSS